MNEITVISLDVWINYGHHFPSFGGHFINHVHRTGEFVRIPREISAQSKGDQCISRKKESRILDDLVAISFHCLVKFLP